MALARFVALHEVAEADCGNVGRATFAVVIARSANGVVLVFNRYRKVWEVPGGFIDGDESARGCAARELAEEAGCTARNLEWLGLVDVAGLEIAAHFGAVFACDVDYLPTSFANDEIGAVAACRRESRPQPLADCDAALLNRFG